MPSRPIRPFTRSTGVSKPFRGALPAAAGLSGALLLACSAILAGKAGAPAPVPGEQERADARVQVERVRLVLLPVSVTGSGGRPVKGLGPTDFRLQDDGVPQKIAVFATESAAPMIAVILLDLSGSMRGQRKLERAKAAARALIDDMGPEDRVGLIGFADEQVTWITDLTADPALFLRRLDVQEAYGPTALWDALAASPYLVEEQARGRRAIVLITDGLDTASRLTSLQAAWTARRVNVPIYILGFIPSPESALPRRGRDGLRALRRFSAETGGLVFPIYHEKDLKRAVVKIRQELRFQYLIGFYPSGSGRDGAFHAIRLETLRGGWEVRTRRGYYAMP